MDSLWNYIKEKKSNTQKENRYNHMFIYHMSTVQNYDRSMIVLATFASASTLIASFT